MVQMTQLRTAAAELELAPVLELEGDPPVRHRLDLCGAAVDEPEAVVIPGPADAVPGPELDPLGPVDLGAAPAPADFRRLPGNRAAALAFQPHGIGLVVDTDHLIALLDAEPLVWTVERHHVTLGVVARERLLGVGVALRDLRRRPRRAQRHLPRHRRPDVDRHRAAAGHGPVPRRAPRHPAHPRHRHPRRGAAPPRRRAQRPPLRRHRRRRTSARVTAPRAASSTWTAGIVAWHGHPLLARDASDDDLARCPWIDYDAPVRLPPDDPRPSFATLLEQLHRSTRTRVRTVVDAGSFGLLLMAGGPYLAWLSLTFLERLPGGFASCGPCRSSSAATATARGSSPGAPPRTCRRSDASRRSCATPRSPGRTEPRPRSRRATPTHASAGRQLRAGGRLLRPGGRRLAASGRPRGPRVPQTAPCPWGAGVCRTAPALHEVRRNGTLAPDPHPARMYDRTARGYRMNKSELASGVATRTSVTKATADSVAAAVFATIAEDAGARRTGLDRGLRDLRHAEPGGGARDATPPPGRASPSPPPPRRRSRPAGRSATRSIRRRADDLVPDRGAARAIGRPSRLPRAVILRASVAGRATRCAADESPPLAFRSRHLDPGPGLLRRRSHICYPGALQPGDFRRNTSWTLRYEGGRHDHLPKVFSPTNPPSRSSLSNPISHQPNVRVTYDLRQRNTHRLDREIHNAHKIHTAKPLQALPRSDNRSRRRA